MSLLSLLLAVLGGIVLVRFRSESKQTPKVSRFPPGPKPKPIIGNLFDFPRHKSWILLREWTKKYGDLVYLHIFGVHIVYVNSRELAHEIFERRSSIYSDRMLTTMIEDILQWDWNMAVQRYGPWWRRHRRAVHQKFHSKVVNLFHPVETRNARKLLLRLLHSPEQFSEHLTYTFGATIMEVAYGIQIQSQDDPYLDIAEKVLRISDEVGIPGRFLVDFLPWMKYIPAWVPGAHFQKQGIIWRQNLRDLLEPPFKETKRRMAEYGPDSSFVSASLVDISRKNYDAEEEEIIMNVAAILAIAGTDTTAQTTRTFILVMVLHPEVQKKAHQELDKVLGYRRMVEIGDMSSLPYVAAVCKEALRWHPLIPLGVPHRSTEDDIVHGYFIPKGTVVFGNAWEILHTEADFGPNPDKFDPERFFRQGVQEPTNNGPFGFGRRICPGRFMAMDSLFLVIASILHVFEICNPRDDSGKEIPIQYNFTSGFFSFPTEFKCRIQPRSSRAESLIMKNGNFPG